MSQISQDMDSQANSSKLLGLKRSKDSEDEAEIPQKKLKEVSFDSVLFVNRHKNKFRCL